MTTFGNVIWVIFGGIFICIHYAITSIILCLTLIGIPFGIQTFKIATLAIWPFGREAVPKQGGSGCVSVFMNIIWFFIGGIWLAIHHLLWAILFGITIIGIPFAVQHIKLAGLALSPFGREIRDIPVKASPIESTSPVPPPPVASKVEDVPAAPSPANSRPDTPTTAFPPPTFQSAPIPPPNPVMMPVAMPMTFTPAPMVQAGIRFFAGEMAGNDVPLVPGQPLVIGREPLKSNIVISHPAISRTHVSVIYDQMNNVFQVKDLNSSHGVKVDGVTLQNGESRNVPTNAVIELGPGTVIFRTMIFG